MKIRLYSLYLTNYEDKDKKKENFLKQVKDDETIKEFVSTDIEEDLRKIEPYKNDNKALHVGPTYIVAIDNKLIGFVRFASFKEGKLNLHYGVVPSYRNHGYGTRILKETGTFVLKNIPEVQKVVLNIKPSNKGSIKAAINAGYRYEKSTYDSDGLNEVKVYVKRKKL